MSTINSILIKRRLASSPLNSVPTLSGGELAFSEKNNTLYYGGEFSTLEIGGDGAYVTRNTSQTISGDKTFSGSTTLSSTTFSSGSLLDFGGNVVTNLGTPLSNSDAATKLYVDSVANSSSTATESLSTEVYNTFVKLTDDRAVNLSGGLTVTSGINSDTVTTTGNASVGGNLVVTGDLSVLGATTTIETTTTMTSAFAITNAGSGPALAVTQTGATDVAAFYDGDEAHVSLIIKDGGNVGIGTSTPNEKLTVVGSISATQHFYGVNGDFTGTLDVDGAATLGSTLSVTGNSTLAGSLTVNNSVSATGAVDFDSTLDVAGNTSLQGTLTVNGALSLDNGAITSDGSGNVTTSGNITGNGTTTITNFVIDGGSF